MSGPALRPIDSPHFLIDYGAGELNTQPRARPAGPRGESSFLAQMTGAFSLFEVFRHLSTLLPVLRKMGKPYTVGTLLAVCGDPCLLSHPPCQTWRSQEPFQPADPRGLLRMLRLIQLLQLQVQPPAGAAGCCRRGVVRASPCGSQGGRVRTSCVLDPSLARPPSHALSHALSQAWPSLLSLSRGGSGRSQEAPPPST